MSSPPLPQDLTCLNFPGRKYVQKSDDSLTQKPWEDDQDDPILALNFAAPPNWTASAPYCVKGQPCNGQGCSCPTSLFSSQGLDTGDAQLIGCGNCSGGTNWECCSCCVQSWWPGNKSKCCDPTPNDEKKAVCIVTQHGVHFRQHV